jgi:hypothetical protein
MSSSKGGGPRGAPPISRANEDVPRTARVGVRNWTCTDSCGYKASGRRQAIKHINAEHAKELEDGGSDVSALLASRHLACCAACYRVTAATAEGNARATHKCKATKDEVHDAPPTPMPAKATKRPARSSGSPKARTPKRLKGEAHVAPTTPGRPSRTTAGGSARRSSAAESSGVRLARSVSASSAGRVVETGVSGSGRKLTRRLFHDEESVGEGTAAGGEPSATSPPPAPTPPAPAPVVVSEAPVPELIRTFTAWTGKALPLFEQLNDALAGNGPATADATLLLRNVLTSSWHVDRTVRVWKSVDDKAEAMEAYDAKRADAAWDALSNLKKGLHNRATKSFSSKGLANLALEASRNALEAKYPTRMEDLTDEVLNAWKTAAPVDPFSSDDVGGAVSKKKKGSGGDDHRWTYDDLKGLASVAGGYAFATPLINAIAQGRFNHDAKAIELLTSCAALRSQRCWATRPRCARLALASSSRRLRARSSASGTCRPSRSSRARTSTQSARRAASRPSAASRTYASRAASPSAGPTARTPLAAASARRCSRRSTRRPAWSPSPRYATPSTPMCAS